ALMPAALSADPSVELFQTRSSYEANFNIWADEYRGLVCRQFRRSTVSQCLVACRHEAADLRDRRIFDPRNHLSRRGKADWLDGFRDLRGGMFAHTNVRRNVRRTRFRRNRSVYARTRLRPDRVAHRHQTL